MLARRIERREDDVRLTQVIDRATLLEMQAAVELVHVEPSVGRYIVDLVAATRESTSLAVGASPRGSLALLKLSRCRAALAGRDFVTPDDVKAVAVPALAHRLVLKPELWVQRRSGEDVVRETLATVPTPPAEDVGSPRRRRGRRRAVTPFASPRLASYLGLAALGLIAALALRRAELVVVAAPFALVVAAGLLLEGATGRRRWLRSTATGPSRATRSRPRSRSTRDVAVDLLELHLVLPDGLAVVEGDNPCGLRLARRRGADAAADAPLRALGLGRARRHPPARARADRDARLGGPRPTPAPDPGLSAARAPPEPRRAARDPARDRRSRRAGAGGRPRVRRHARLRARRSAALGQLARERPPRRADRQRASPGPERRRRPLPRQLRRGPERRRGPTGRSSAPCARRRRSPAATSRVATGSGSSPSAASSVGSSPAAASSSATA